MTVVIKKYDDDRDWAPHVSEETFNGSKDEIIERVDTLAEDLGPEKKLVVENFGKDQNMVLHIYKDSEFDPDEDPEYSNLVSMATTIDDEAVDDLEDTFVTDGEFRGELERIWEHKDLHTLS